MLIVGGENADGVELASAELFDLAGPSGAIGSMSTPRKGLTATALLDGQVLIAGGNNGTNDLAYGRNLSRDLAHIFPGHDRTERRSQRSFGRAAPA